VGGGPVDSEVGRAFAVLGFEGCDAVGGEVGVPAFDLRTGGALEGLEVASGGWGQRPGRRVAGDDDLDVGPIEFDGGLLAVGRLEEDRDGPGRVVVAGDGADVASVQGADPVADSKVGGGVPGLGVAAAQRLGVDAGRPGGVLLDGSAEHRPGFEVGEMVDAGQGVDVVSVRIARQRQELGPGPLQAAGDLVEGVAILDGEPDGRVMPGELGVEVIELGPGDDEPVRILAPGELGVARFLVEAVGADGDSDVPRPALGAVGRQGVAVGDVAGVEVVGGQRGRGTVVIESHGDAVATEGCPGDGGGLRVEDAFTVPVAGRMPVEGAAEHDPVTVRQVVAP
jgi:hypothetical protein